MLDSSANTSRSTVNNNNGGIIVVRSDLTLTDSTVTANFAGSYDQNGGGIAAFSSHVIIRNSTITGNTADNLYGPATGGGIYLNGSSTLDIANSIVAGNSTRSGTGDASAPDIFGSIASSNGHNIFGSDVLGNVTGDRENVASAALFATVDP